MIFKTENNEFTILRNTLSNIHDKWSDFVKDYEQNHQLFGEGGAFSSLFSNKNSNSKSVIDEKLLGDFGAFKDLFNESSLSAEVLAEDLGGVEQSGSLLHTIYQNCQKLNLRN